MKECFVVLGNQLFEKKNLKDFKNSCEFFIQEDLGLCSYFKHHKQKIYYFLASMREYRDYLKKNNFKGISCGNLTFRTETMPIVALSMIKALYGVKK